MNSTDNIEVDDNSNNNFIRSDCTSIDNFT